MESFWYCLIYFTLGISIESTTTVVFMLRYILNRPVLTIRSSRHVLHFPQEWSHLRGTSTSLGRPRNPTQFFFFFFSSKPRLSLFSVTSSYWTLRRVRYSVNMWTQEDPGRWPDIIKSHLFTPSCVYGCLVTRFSVFSLTLCSLCFPSARLHFSSLKSPGRFVPRNFITLFSRGRWNDVRLLNSWVRNL